MTYFTGSGVIHMTGGVAALCGAVIVGPRTGRFSESSEHNYGPTSVLNIALGTFILWFGWFGFNGGSTLGLSGGVALQAAQACVVTTMSAAFGGIVSFLVSSFLNKKYDVCAFANGILAGLVGITAGCGNMDVPASCGIGMVSGVIVVLSSNLLQKLKIDDPVDAFSVHGACGIWGVVAAGLFDKDLGLFTGEEGDFHAALGPNLVGILAIATWSAGVSTPIFLVLLKLNLLRASEAEQMEGLDQEFTAVRGPVDQIAIELQKLDKDVLQVKGESKATFQELQKNPALMGV